ncbi:hypothetical protein SDRG_07084 [Saprolegnia diclina VS20]|uniref:EGF-like domain-containing protein n=1 Tax=Saprolegnia diclina (strain VS20) TaxID=1156394 RepID=T0RYB4_SAPDV|nr:hypothetical protein SDRG_07084 [Saprolegnia diclina VS20]EQC35372.1 hypothetical protein SDRG_07084 [Saprolegnia diclina VS20]|eukprot:XP_008611122.1 hypothetical protein SDRG_07084 [Saprolegnia diclina VS20]
MGRCKKMLLALVALVYLASSVTGAPALASDCTSDAECPDGTGCITIKHASYNPSAVLGKCTPKQLCRGSSVGNCPSFNAPSAPGGYLQTQCVFINTTRLRNIKCCTGNSAGTTAGGDSAGTGGNSSRVRLLTNDSTITSLSNLPADSTDCFQCYRDPLPPKGSTGYYAGQFFCVPQQECKASSVFPLACNSGNMCNSGVNELCNLHGTCTPLDINDPKGSYGCACNAGFSGGQCENVVSSSCLFDCGDGNIKGTCIDGQCVCKKGWSGPQCTLCTSDTACGGGLCNTGSGQCSCLTNTTMAYERISNVCYPGGATTGTTNACTGVICGALGSCQAGACVCARGCAGTICKPCADPSCRSCSPAVALRPSLGVAASVLLAALAYLRV